MANRAPKTLMIRTRPSTIPLESIGSPSTDLEAPDGQYAVVSMETMEVMQERESDDHAKKEESIYTRIKMNLRVVLNHTNCRRLKNHFKTLILYFAFQIIVLYVEFAIFWETFVPFCGGKFALFVYLCFLLAAFVMYFFIFFSNPGYVKVISVSDAESDELEPSTIELNSEIKHLEKRDLLGPRGSGESKSSWNYCESCNAWRAPRSRHCDICGYCVVKFDHHCPFFNNCIGGKNHPCFLAFLFIKLICLVWTLEIVARQLYLAYYDDDFNRTGFILHTLLTIQLSTMSISVLFMAFFHLNLALSNSTTYEKIVSMRAHYGHYHLHSHKCGSESKSEDPNHIEFSGPEVVNYNQGLWRNIISYLRREFPVEWLYTHAAPLEFQDECSQIV